jgi:hypothetical protein
MKGLHINKIFGKIIKGEYLLIYIFIYIVSFGIVNYVAEKGYIGIFSLNPGLKILNLPGADIKRGDAQRINDAILALGSIEIPKKYNKSSDTGLIYIKGKTRKEVLNKSEEVLDFIDTYKAKHYGKPTDVEILEQQYYKNIYEEYTKYAGRIRNALKNSQYLFSQASDTLEILKGMEKKDIKKISIKCRSKERLQANSLCTNYEIYSYLTQLKEDLSVIDSNKLLLLNKIKAMKETYIFENAIYMKDVNIEEYPLIQKSIYSLAFLFSILGVSLIAFFKLLKFFTKKQ